MNVRLPPSLHLSETRDASTSAWPWHVSRISHLILLKRRAQSPEIGMCRDTLGNSGFFSLRSRRSSSVDFLFRFFAGKFGRNFGGKFGGNFVGIFLTHRIKAQKFRGKFRSIFGKKILSSKKIFRAKVTLQTCHLKGLCRIFCTKNPALYTMSSLHNAHPICERHPCAFREVAKRAPIEGIGEEKAKEIAILAQVIRRDPKVESCSSIAPAQLSKRNRGELIDFKSIYPLDSQPRRVEVCTALSFEL